MESVKGHIIYQAYRIISSTSSSEGSTSSSDNSDSPIKRFNRLVRTSVSRHWAYLRSRPSLRERGRSVSDSGLCTIVDHDPDISYLDIKTTPRPRRRSFKSSHKTASRLYLKSNSVQEVPTFQLTSAGGGSHIGIEEASDGSDAERPRRSHHLRVPTPAFVGQSTGNFAAGAAGGGSGVPRSAPATPLQLEPQPRPSKHDKQVIKPLSGSAPSVRSGGNTNDTAEGKPPSKSRQKKFQRHFPQVGPEEKVLNYYSCALVGDLLLQGHLYITKNYFAFYSNVFGYVTKLLIPTTSVLRITKEKVARIIPNAVGVCTRDERHVFGSLLSRDSTFKLMTNVWKTARGPEVVTSKTQELRTSEVEHSEYSLEDDSSSAGGDRVDAPEPNIRRESEGIIAASVAGAAVIQPALLTGTAPRPRPTRWQAAFVLVAVFLTLTALFLSYRLYVARTLHQEELSKLSGEQLYSELLRWRTRLHGRAASDLHTFLTTNLLLLTKVRQSLEALSGVILSDMAHNAQVPTDAVFS